MACENHRKIRRTSSLTHLLDETSLRTCDTPAASRLINMVDTEIAIRGWRSLDTPSSIVDQASHFGKDFDLSPKMYSSVGGLPVSSLFDVCGQRPLLLASEPAVPGSNEVGFECASRFDHVPLGTEGHMSGHEMHTFDTSENSSSRNTDVAVAAHAEAQQLSPWCYGADIATESWVPPSSAPQHDIRRNFLVTCDFCQISLDQYDIYMYG